MIRVLIADDYPIVREGFKGIISKTSDIAMAGEASNGQEVLDKVATETFDVVLLDLNLPGKDGFVVLNELKRLNPRLPVLVLSMHPENQVGVRVLRSGACGFMNKETAPNELIDAIRTVYSGRKYVSAFLAEKLASLVQGEPQLNPHETLSDREYQVLCKIASGLGVESIGEELCISAKTVRTYRDRVLKKLNLNNDVEIARYAMEHKLLG